MELLSGSYYADLYNGNSNSLVKPQRIVNAIIASGIISLGFGSGLMTGYALYEG